MSCYTKRILSLPFKYVPLCIINCLCLPYSTAVLYKENASRCSGFNFTDGLHFVHNALYVLVHFRFVKHVHVICESEAVVVQFFVLFWRGLVFCLLFVDVDPARYEVVYNVDKYLTNVKEYCLGRQNI
jgi:hypothetical protein